jgi:diguanylate cyclase (GGDEF)-like protein/PAS domain S-box-containing protein
VGLLIDVLSSQLALLGSNPCEPDSLEIAPCRDLVENVADMVYIQDLEGRIASVNRAAESLTGYTRAQLLAMRMADLLSPESAEMCGRMTVSTLGSGSRSTFELDLLRRDGRSVRMEVTTRLLFRQGRPHGVIGVARQVQRQRVSEADLRLLKSVVVNANDAVMIAEAKPGDQLGGKIVYVNEAFSRMTGYSSEEAVGRTPRILLGPQTDRDQLNVVRTALSNWEAVRVEVVNYRSDGSAYWVDVNFVPITGDGGEFTHWVAVQRETTHRKQAEDLERDRNRVLELMARNEPLETVLAHLLQMVERQCPDLRCTLLLLRDGQMLPVAGAKLSTDALRLVQEAQAGLPPRPPGPADHREMLPGPHLGASWSVPILSGSTAVLGAFAIHCGVTRKPAEAELEMISKASRLAAIAIEQKQLTEKLAHQAQHDALTGLPNRALFEERLHRALAQGRAQGWNVSVLFIDLDRFKQINDTLGHAVGDALLQQVARRLEGCLRRTDMLARMGGDEFTVVLSELRDPQYAQTVAQKLLDTLKAPFHVGGYELFVTASIGISGYPRDGRDAATLQRNADSAMYRAKTLGRNNYQAFMPEIGAGALESLEIENALRRAMENDEFQLRYQKQVDLQGRLAGLEALLVWSHAKLGPISPTQFIPVAEESGLIVPIGAWVIGEACRQRAEWQNRFPRLSAKVAVNVSVVQFTRKGFVESVALALKQTGLDPSFLELELTESVVVRDVQESVRQMERLRSIGVSLAIDDFGTGYSSLSYLRMLPLDTLKIDRSFLREVESDPHQMPLVRAIVALAHSLRLSVTAEGVETPMQLEALRSVGCDQVQGYLIGEPVGPDAIELLLAESEDLGASPEPTPAGRIRRAHAFFATP